MIIDYLTLGGAEIINTMRADAYGGSETDGCGGDLVTGCGCDEPAGEWLNNGEPYKGIALDPAPWYDEGSPESLDVSGFVGLTIEGTETGAYPTRGSDNQGPQGATREIEITLLVAARTECALSYAIGWLAAAIKPGTCGDDCGGVSACLLACCPDVDENTGELIGPNPIRHIFDLRPIDGPTIEEIIDDGIEITAEISMTFATFNTGIFRPAPDNATFVITPATGERVRIDPTAIYEDCPEPEPCGVDPDCSPPPLAPLPNPPIDDCYPSDPFDAYRTQLTVPTSALASAFDTVPVITVEAGAQPLRNLIVRFHNNPYGVPCDRLPELNPCRTCGDLVVPFVPAGGRLELDGRTQRAMITCRNPRTGTSKWIPPVYGRPGLTAEWPKITCETGICVEVFTADTVGSDTMIRLELVARQEAG